VIAIYEAASEHYAPAEHPATGHQTILYVGRLDPYKNVAALVRAFGRIRRSGASNVRLRLIGPPDDRYPEVRQLIATENLAGHIDGPGYVSGDELRAAYQSADVFVLPSLYEGFGLPVLEAMACGTPVVCSRRASLPEVAGDAALLVDPENIDELTHAIQTILHDPAQAATLRRKGLARAAGFSWDRTARNTLRVYQQLMPR
jgi:glycosyltransferase involved in cell wall biosynthesis